MAFGRKGYNRQKIFEWLDDTTLISLALLLRSDNQLEAAEEAASRALNLGEKVGQLSVCLSRRALGHICRSKGEPEKAIHHFEAALAIASSSNWNTVLFWIHYYLVGLLLDRGRLDDAHAHAEQAKSRANGGLYLLGHAMHMQARVWYMQRRLEEARSEALCAVDTFEKLGVARETESHRKFLQRIEQELNKPVASGQSGFDCELPQTFVLPPARINRSF